MNKRFISRNLIFENIACKARVENVKISGKMNPRWKENKKKEIIIDRIFKIVLDSM